MAGTCCHPDRTLDLPDVARPRLLELVRGLDRRSAGTVVLAGAGLSLGFIQLLATPLQDVTAVDVQVLAVRTSLYMAPLAVTLLQLLREGPLLIEEARVVTRLGVRGWQLRLPRVLAMALSTLVLVLYFETAALVAAVVTKPEADAVGEMRFLMGNLDPVLFVVTLAKAGLFGAIASLLCLHQGAWFRGRRTTEARAMSEAIVVTTAALLAIDLVWVLAADPLQMAGNG
jgi:hypothetical protein